MKKKVLLCIPNLGICNGVTTFIMSFYDSLLAQGYQVDFLLVINNYSEMESYIQERGSKIYKVPNGKKYDKRRIDYIEKVFQNETYDIVHVNFPGANGAIVLKAAKKNGVSYRVYHCHNPFNTSTVRTFISEMLFTPLCKLRANRYVACSEAAGRTIFRKKKFEVINNAINPTEFLFSEESRTSIRKKYQIENRLVVGVAARMAEQKNPLFIIKIFAQMHKENKNAVLLWVGDGNMREKIEQACIEHNVQDAVLLVGRQSNMVEWYSAMDLFLLPSKFEGLGIVYLEAQANGLYCFGSQCVPRETEVTERMHRISLKKKPEEWSAEILKTMEMDAGYRGIKEELFKEKNYDSRFTKNRLCELYASFDKE